MAMLAAMGLSACSHNPSAKNTASVPHTDKLNAPFTHELDADSDNAQIARALDLQYSKPQVAAPLTTESRRSYIVEAAPLTEQQFAKTHPPHNVPASLPGYRPQQVVARSNASRNGMPQLSSTELRAIGKQIFINEGGGNMKRLVHWNVGEDFASMGIGHFLWYPAGRKQSFGNTFPGLLDYMAGKGVQLPGWLQQARRTGAPWRSRSELLQASNSAQVRELQELLYNTQEIQAEYIVNRARQAMPRLVKTSTGNMQQHVAQNLNAVANTSGGWYALIDYVNFKGEGLGSGGYKGYSWGLRQVLEEMRPSAPGQQALHEFADAAMRVLHRRVRNSDPSRNEARWLKGWQNRVNTYRNPIV